MGTHEPKPIREPTWVRHHEENQATYLVPAGLDKSGENVVFVARASHEGTMFPAKYCARQTTASILYNGKEIAKSEFEVLLAPPGSLSWIDGDNIETSVLLVVIDEEEIDGVKERSHVGRAYHNGDIRLGRITCSGNACDVSQELLESGQVRMKYEVLAKNSYGFVLAVEAMAI